MFDNQEMEMEVVHEEPIVSYYGCCPEYDQKIELFRKDLENAKIGDSWSCEDQDTYPNRTEDWSVTLTVVFIKGNIIYLHQTDNDHGQEKLFAVTLH